MKRNDPCFWLTDNCPACGHSCPVIYSPDLLNGPIERECGSKNNPIRKNSVCYEKWTFAATDKQKYEIIELLKLADRQDKLNTEYLENRVKLGYMMHTMQKEIAKHKPRKLSRFFSPPADFQGDIYKVAIESEYKYKAYVKEDYSTIRNEVMQIATYRRKIGEYGRVYWEIYSYPEGFEIEDNGY